MKTLFKVVLLIGLSVVLSEIGYAGYAKYGFGWEYKVIPLDVDNKQYQKTFSEKMEYHFRVNRHRLDWKKARMLKTDPFFSGAGPCTPYYPGYFVANNAIKFSKIHRFDISNTIDSICITDKKIAGKLLYNKENVVYPRKFNFRTKENEYKTFKYRYHKNPKFGFFDDIAPNKWLHTTVGSTKYVAPKDYSLFHPEDYPMKYRVWAGKKRKNNIEYCSMIDDDIMYDFRDEKPFDKILTTNKNGPFLYVYDFKRYRKSSSDWAFHDRLLYGHDDNFIEDRMSKHEWDYRQHKQIMKGSSKGPTRRQTFHNKAKLTYGPLINDPNSELLRKIRVYIFTRMYMAKLRLTKLCHPAPKWYKSGFKYRQTPSYSIAGMYKKIKEYETEYIAGHIGDYNYKGKLNNKRWDTKMCNIKKYANFKKYPVGQFEKAKKDYQKAIAHMNIYDYWEGLYLKYIPIDSYLKAYDKYMAGTGSLKSLRWWGRMYNLAEAFRDMYPEMSLATPIRCPSVKKEDYKRYFNKNYVSIALWAGSSGSGEYRHRLDAGLKTMFPYFEGRDKPGKMLNYNGTRIRTDFVIMGYNRWFKEVIKFGRNLRKECRQRNGYSMRRGRKTGATRLPITKIYKTKVRKIEVMNTGGLIYGGYADATTHKNYSEVVKEYGSVKKVWDAALNGPFMIVSTRTWRKYGHEYFEKLAGHKLMKVNVTGAMIDSSAKTIPTIDHDYVDQLKDMDYFYIKENGNWIRTRDKRYRYTSKLTYKKLGQDNMHPARDITITTNKPDREGLHKDYIAANYSYDNSQPKVDTVRNRWEYIEGKQFVKGNNKKLFDKIRTAYNKDKKRYPELSILRANHIRKSKKTKFVHGIEFINVIHKMKEKERTSKRKTIVKLFDNDKKLMRFLRKKLPMFAGNPNLFKVYYNNLNLENHPHTNRFGYITSKDKTIFKPTRIKARMTYHERPSQLAKTIDGTVSHNYFRVLPSSIQNYSLRNFVKNKQLPMKDMLKGLKPTENVETVNSSNDDSSNDNTWYNNRIFTKYLISSSVNTEISENMADNIPPYSTLRYNMIYYDLMAYPLSFVKSTMQFYNYAQTYVTTKIEEINRVTHKLYREIGTWYDTTQQMISPAGKSIDVRRLDARITHDGMKGSEIYSYAFPGMFRYMTGVPDYIPFKFYHRRERHQKDPGNMVEIPDLSIAIYPFGSEHAILSDMALPRTEKDIKHATYASGLQRMNLLKKLIPTNYLERIIVPGIKTTVLKKKCENSADYTYPSELDKLYKGVSGITNEERVY